MLCIDVGHLLPYREKDSGEVYVCADWYNVAKHDERCAQVWAEPPRHRVRTISYPRRPPYPRLNLK